MKCYIKDCSGASAVEFALLTPFLLFILIGTVDIGFFILDRMQLHSMTYTAADYVAEAGNNANVDTVAEQAYRGDFDDVTLTSTFSCECSDGVAQECPLDCGEDDYSRRFITVTASGTFAPLFEFPGLPGSIDLESSVRRRVD